ncbi:Hypothetical protein FKW44_017583 [Caligus rogercresseyi]|uniref:Uncharacterized protein n=1 Tax=Caligus rogercresseyi TaxID=217165 RepID=A0A7T8GTM6_CALRO|nr:Hypothetical protein FKW44_017583 [Caligus rogercresseyi]
MLRSFEDFNGLTVSRHSRRRLGFLGERRGKGTVVLDSGSKAGPPPTLTLHGQVHLKLHATHRGAETFFAAKECL